MKTFNAFAVAAESTPDAAESSAVSFGDAFSSMSTTTKVVVGVGVVGAIGAGYALGSWFAGRKADKAAADAAPAAPVTTVVEAAKPAPAAPTAA